MQQSHYSQLQLDMNIPTHTSCYMNILIGHTRLSILGPMHLHDSEAFIAEAAPSSSGRCSACNASKQRRTKRGALKKWAKRSKYLVPNVSSWLVIVSVSNYCSWCSAYSKRTNWFRPSTEKKLVLSSVAIAILISISHVVEICEICVWFTANKSPDLYNLNKSNHNS